MGQVEEVKEAPKGASEDVFFEYLRDYRVDAYQLFIDIVNNLRKIIAEANASEEDKVDAAFLLGRVAESVESLMRLSSPKADNEIVEAVKALLKMYVALKERPLYDINEDLTDFSFELSKAVGELIMGLSKWCKATNETPSEAQNKA